MKSRILLVNPKSNLDFFFSNPPPLGPLYLVSYLRSKGVEAEFIDLNLEKNLDKVLEKEINEYNPNFIGITSNIANIHNAQYIASRTKKINNDIKVIIGGPFPTSSPEYVLENKHVDSVCIGEGEETLYEYITKGDKVPGLMVRKNNSFQYTGKRDYIQNLDELPFPALDEVNLKKYWVNVSKAHPISILISSRGCPYNCVFCFHGVHGQQWRTRSPKNVLKELEWQINTLGAREICFWDDNFSLNTDRVYKICRLIKEGNLKFHWQLPNGIRVDKISFNLLREMKSTGFWKLLLSPETGDPKILKKIDKGFTLDTVEKVTRWCKQLNIFIVMDFIYGFPWEDEISLRKTLDLAFKLNPEIISFYKLNVFPKTRLYEITQKSTFMNKGFFDSSLDKNIEKAYKNAYLRFYLRPKKILELSSKIKLKNLISLSWRALKLKVKGYI